MFKKTDGMAQGHFLDEDSGDDARVDGGRCAHSIVQRPLRSAGSAGANKSPVLGSSPLVGLQGGETDAGLWCTQLMRRKYVICYVPSVVKRIETIAGSSQALTLLSPKGNRLRAFACDGPSAADLASFLPQWRQKSVIKTALELCSDSAQKANARVELPVDCNPRVGNIHYVPVLALREIKEGEQIIVDGTHWQHSACSASRPLPPDSDQGPLQWLIANG